MSITNITNVRFLQAIPLGGQQQLSVSEKEAALSLEAGVLTVRVKGRPDLLVPMANIAFVQLKQPEQKK